MSSGNWENNPAGDWFKRIWEAWKPNKYRFFQPSLPNLITTKATVAPDCKVSIGIANPGEGEIQVDVNASETIDLTLNRTEVVSVRVFPETIRDVIREAGRVLDELPIPEEDRIVWPISPQAGQECLPPISKPPISSSTCSSCKAEKLENFLRAGGKVYCHKCVDKFPACCFCSQKVPWEGSYTSKRDDKRIACPPCLEERKDQKLVKEVSE